MNKREILDAVSNKIDFKIDKSVYAIRVLKVQGEKYDELYEYQLRTFLGRTIDSNRKVWHWSRATFFHLCLMHLSKMIESGQLINELK